MERASRAIAILLVSAAPAITGCKGFFVPICEETNTCPATTAVPTASPAGGAFSTAQTVTLSDATSGATICYTIDGSTPAAATPGTCSHGTVYSSAISVSATTTIKAIGTLAAATNSSQLTSTYTIL